MDDGRKPGLTVPAVPPGNPPIHIPGEGNIVSQDEKVYASGSSTTTTTVTKYHNEMDDPESGTQIVRDTTKTVEKVERKTPRGLITVETTTMESWVKGEQGTLHFIESEQTTTEPRPQSAPESSPPQKSAGQPQPGPALDRSHSSSAIPRGSQPYPQEPRASQCKSVPHGGSAFVPVGPVQREFATPRVSAFAPPDPGTDGQGSDQRSRAASISFAPGPRPRSASTAERQNTRAPEDHQVATKRRSEPSETAPGAPSGPSALPPGSIFVAVFERLPEDGQPPPASTTANRAGPEQRGSVARAVPVSFQPDSSGGHMQRASVGPGPTGLHEPDCNLEPGVCSSSLIEPQSERKRSVPTTSDPRCEQVPQTRSRAASVAGSQSSGAGTESRTPRKSDATEKACKRQSGSDQPE